MNRLAPFCAMAAVAIGGCSDFGTAPTRTPAELRIVPDDVLALTGEPAEFEVEVLDEDGETYDVLPGWSMLWTSDRPERVQAEGARVIPLMGGQNRLELQVGGLQADLLLRANPAELAVSVPMAHITQSVQRTGGDLGLVAGRPGLLRVVVTGDEENFYRPRVRALFYQGETEVHTTDLEVEHEGLPVDWSEGRPELSYDGHIPGSVLQPGVRMVLEVDPQGVVPATSGSELRIPATGSLALDVQDVPPFRLMMVPVTLAANGGRESRLTDPEFAADVTRLTGDIFPLAEMEVSVREPYVTQEDLATVDGWYNLIGDLDLVRMDDGNPHYYYGGFDRPPGTSIGGLGYVGYPVSIGMEDRPDVIAHEIGHNFGLLHAPCGGPTGVDQQYPYPRAMTGVYGYDRSTGDLHPPDQADLMSYCDPFWISDYHYERVVEYRANSPYDAAFVEARGAGLRSPETRTLVVRGGVLEGRLRLEPGLEWTGPVVMPNGDGRYTLEGLNAAGGVLFSVSLEPTELGNGGAQFLVALPADLARPDELARLRLRGPEGVVERSRKGDAAVEPRVRVERPALPGTGRVEARWDAGAYPLAVVRDRESGRILTITRSAGVALPDADISRYEVVLSDGVGSRAVRVVQQ